MFDARISICFLLLLAVTGCTYSNPLAKVPRPNKATIHSAGSETVVTEQGAVDKIFSQFGGLKGDWHRHGGKLPSPDVRVVLDKDGKPVAILFLFVSSLRVYVAMPDSEVYTYWTSLTKEEHDNFFSTLGVKAGD